MLKGKVPDGATAERMCWRVDDLAEPLELCRRSLEDTDSLRAAKRLLGRVLSEYLGEHRLKSRSVLKDIVELGVEQ